MTRSTTLRLSPFAVQALEGYVGEEPGGLASAVRTGFLYYLAEGESDRTGWRVPRFAREARAQADQRDLTVELDNRLWARLAAEARRQGVSPELLLRHALMWLLADLDSGRVAARVAAGLEEPAG